DIVVPFTVRITSPGCRRRAAATLAGGAEATRSPPSALLVRPRAILASWRSSTDVAGGATSVAAAGAGALCAGASVLAAGPGGTADRPGAGATDGVAEAPGVATSAEAGVAADGSARGVPSRCARSTSQTATSAAPITSARTSNRRGD